MPVAPSLYGELFKDHAMAALFSPAATLQGMLDFEAALARDQAEEGIIPASAVTAITQACRADLFDLFEIGRQTTLAGNPAIPAVKLLTAKVAEQDGEAARWVHWGATSQDMIDTGTMLQVASALSLLRQRLDKLCGILAHLTHTHRAAVMPGRTLLQHALPVTFGLKTAYWLDALLGHVTALECMPPMGAAQMGGAAGTLASLGDKGADLQIRMSGGLTAVPWHTTRQGLVRIGAECGMISGTLGKIARDIALMMQTEVGEVFEPAQAGKGGSSALPHKRNPVQSLAMSAIANRTPGLVSSLLTGLVQEHERAVGGWHAEWEVLPELFCLTGASLHHAIEMLAGLEVNTSRMRANLDITHGLVLSERVALALGAKIGRMAAKNIVEEASKAVIAQNRHLLEILSKDPRVTASLPQTELAGLFDPSTYLGATEAVIERILIQYKTRFNGL